MAQVVRQTTQYFLPDRDLLTALGLDKGVLVLSVERKVGRTKVGEVDLHGCLVTVYDPRTS